MRLPLLALSLPLIGCSASWAPAETGANSDRFPPQVYLTDPADASTWGLSDDVPVRATVVDDLDDAEDLLIEIRSDLEGVLATPTLTADGQLDTTVTLGEGTHVLTVAAIDSLGLEGTDQATIMVGTVLTQPIAAITPEEPVSGDTLTATIVEESVDPDGDAITYTYAWTVDGEDAGISDPTVDGTFVVRGQTWAVTVTGVSDDGTSPPFTTEVVVGNAGPTVQMVWIDPTDPDVTQDLTCQHDEAVDPEGDEVLVSYRWTVDGEAQVESGPVLPAGTALRGAEVGCDAIFDDGDEWRVAAEPVVIGDAPPVVATVEVTPADGDARTPYVCLPSGISDPDGDVVDLAYSWLVDGVEVATGEILDAGSATRGQSVVCVVTPSDGLETGAAASSAPVVVGNIAPDAPGVAFVQSRLVPGVVAECEVTVDSLDADGDAVAYTWSWAVNGAAVAGSDPSYDTSALAAGDALTCTATPDDGTDAGPSASASAVLIAPTTGDLGASAAYATITGTTSNDNFGKVVDTLTDVDGDGLPELLVVAQRVGSSTQGAGYVFTAAQLAAGGAFTSADATWSWLGHATNDYLGGGRGGADGGDLDGDGVGDLLLGATLNDTGAANGGSVYVLYGGAWTSGNDVETEADARISGRAADWLGARLASGDLDGDGLSDLVASAPYNDLAASNAGAVAVFFGDAARLSGAYALTDADALLTGDAASVELGWAASVMGDVDGDGYAELGVSATGDATNASGAGAAALVSGDTLSGQAVYDTVAWRVLYGTEASAKFGWDLAGLGDIDEDGVDDYAIAAYLGDDGGTDGGRVRVFYGTTGAGTSADEDTADLTIASTSGSGQLGTSLHGAWDYDQDGIPDLLASAPRASAGPGGASSGTAYVFLGRDQATWADGTDASLRVHGGAASDYLGDELAGGLDIDGDGYGDFALGAQGADSPAAAAGAVYLFRGP